MFLRAQLSSQLASLTDFLVTIILAKFFGLYYVHATFMGSVCGGVINCIVNYRWTFRADSVKKRYVALKYLFVWTGSIFFNTTGTYLVTELLYRIDLVAGLPPSVSKDVFLIAKIVVSLLVGFGWNYNMQRLFVYKNRHIGKYFRRKRNAGNHTKNGRRGRNSSA